MRELERERSHDDRRDDRRDSVERTLWLCFRLGGGGEGFIFRLACLHSDSHGASLGGSTPTLSSARCRFVFLWVVGERVKTFYLILSLYLEMQFI